MHSVFLTFLHYVGNAVSFDLNEYPDLRWIASDGQRCLFFALEGADESPLPISPADWN